MKRIVGLLASITLVLCVLAGCGASGGSAAQVASTEVDFNGATVKVDVDVSGGWSAEFTEVGTVYLYNVENPGDDATQIANAYIIDQAEYDENVTEYKDYESFTEVENGVKFSEEEGGSNKYLFAVGNGLYYMIAANQDADAESIYARFEVKPGMS
jgi:hypothetical protein